MADGKQVERLLLRPGFEDVKLVGAQNTNLAAEATEAVWSNFGLRASVLRLLD